MDNRYVLINIEEDEECRVFRNLRELSGYIREMYLIERSHMYYHRKLNEKKTLYLEKLIILKINL